MIRSMRPTPGKYQHKGDMDAALGTYQRKGFVPFKSMNTSAKSSPDNVISNNKLSIHGDRPVSPPGAPSALLSRFIKTVKTVTIANQMMRQSVPVHSISLGAESLAMAHGQWDLPKGRPPDALEETKAESIGQALRKVRKGYDIEGAGDGVGMGVVGSKKANPKKHHGGKDLSGGFFQSSKKRNQALCSFGACPSLISLLYFCSTPLPLFSLLVYVFFFCHPPPRSPPLSIHSFLLALPPGIFHD